VTRGGQERGMHCFGRESSERRPFGRPRLRWESNIKKSILNEWCGRVWSRIMLLRIGTSGGLLSTG